MRLPLIFILGLAAFASSRATAQEQTMNPYILRVIERIYPERRDGGYDIKMSYSRALSYGAAGTIPQNPSPRPQGKERATMCVSAVAEIIVEAINLYVAEGHDGRAYQQLPSTTWSRTTIMSMRPYIYLADDSRAVFGAWRRNGRPTVPFNPTTRAYALSRGTGHAFEIFHVGEELGFAELRAGDFVNFNRDHAGGHAVVFLGYIDASNKVTPTWSSSVIGFRYFSAQGMSSKAPDHGFGYRNAYFMGKAPANAGPYADRNVINSSARLYLNGGRLWTPARWNVAAGLQQIDRAARAATPGSGTKRAAGVRAALTEEHLGSAVLFDGVEGE